MIVRQDRGYETSEDFPDSNWYENEPGNYVVDETTEEGRALAEKIRQCSPYMDLVIVDGKLVDVTPTERPPAQPAPPTQEEQIATLNSRLAAAEQAGAETSATLQQLLETMY